MTPEQIQAMVKGAVEASGGPAWWVYALLILCACVGSYLGSYLGEKGKNTATKEDIEAITEKVEAVKQTLASRGWVRQQHWANREKYYLQILSNLALMRTSLADVYAEAVRQRKAPGVPSELFDAKLLMGEYFDAKKKVLELLGPAAVFLPASTLQVIYSFFSKESRIGDEYDNSEDCFRDLTIAISRAFDAVLASAQADLVGAEGSA
ncbi:hypothetical protein LJR074_002175 [Acidovorax sp. LjRoot74]|uniref:hypothetical protein n=1 Tax=Acidovorax sp. LjRoot74 TaxID=3342337 RepID=UPI003ECDBD60